MHLTLCYGHSKGLLVYLLLHWLHVILLKKKLSGNLQQMCNAAKQDEG